MERDFSLLVKVLLVPDEGEDGRWEIPPSAFKVADDETHSLPVNGPAIVQGRLYRDDKTVFFNGEVETTLGLSCSRCLKPYEMEIKEAVTAVFAPRASFAVGTDEYEVIEDDVDMQFYDEDALDLFGPVYDQVALAVPMKPLCDEDCKGLCQKCGKDLNEGSCGCAEPDGDNPFAALRKLKL